MASSGAESENIFCNGSKKQGTSPDSNYFLVNDKFLGSKSHDVIKHVLLHRLKLLP